MVSFVLSFLMLLTFCFEGSAQTPFKQNTILQDDELEETTLIFVEKMFDVANIKAKPILYFIVNKEINAAATLNHTLILYTGFVVFCKNVDEFAGVLAHEVTHIKADHASLQDLHLSQAAMPGFLAMALGGVAALALGSPDVLLAGLAGGVSIMERSILKYSRAQENTADAGALEILEKLNWPVTGIESFLQNLDKRYRSNGLDPYLLTHPLTSDRFQKIKNYIKDHPSKKSIPKELEEKFLRMKGKIIGFTEPIAVILRQYPITAQTIEAKYARTIAYYRSNKKGQFEKEIDQLLKDYPDDTYFLELKGQFCFEKGNKKEALGLFEKARVNRKNKTGLDLLYAHALLELNSDYQKAIDIITPHVQKSPNLIWGWRLLATAYGKQKKMPEAAGCLAEEAFQQGNYKLAMIQAKKALASANSIIKDRATTLMNEIKINNLDDPKR
jgi:predicted Zn-dependent protease